MASSSLNPFVDNTNHQALVLKTTSAESTIFMVAGRNLAQPYEVEFQRKVNPSAASNDHCIIRLSRKEANATTGKLATLQITLDCSIPKDTTILTLTEQKKAIALIASLLNESTAMEATNVAITAILEGRDL